MMKKFLPIAVTGVLLLSTDVNAQDRDPFGGPARDPFADSPKAQIRNSTSKKQATRATAAAKATSVTPAYPCLAAGADSKSSYRIEQALQTETTFDYLDMPLNEVVENLAHHHNIPVVIDVKALEDFGIDARTPVSITLKGIRLRSALNLLLGNLELTFHIRNEVLQITTPEEAGANLSTRFYPVSELLPESKDGKVLVELITTMIAPDSWDSLGGPGAIIYMDHIEALVISQTDATFHEIGDLLAATKKLVDKQPRRAAAKIIPIPDRQP